VYVAIVIVADRYFET